MTTPYWEGIVNTLIHHSFFTFWVPNLITFQFVQITPNIHQSIVETIQIKELNPDIGKIKLTKVYNNNNLHALVHLTLR